MMLDPKRTFDDLIARLARMAAEGKLKVRGPDGPLKDETAIRAHVEPTVDHCLNAFLKNAMLVEA